MTIKLLEHQKRCVDYIKNHRGLILYHSMGSGKTITSLAMAVQFQNPIIIIATKSSKKNFRDDMIKMGITADKVFITTYKKSIRAITEREINFDGKIIIIDEAHRLRNKTKLMNIIIEECKRAIKLILLTGTVFYNSAADLCTLANMVKGYSILPEDPKLFLYYYYNEYFNMVADEDDLRNKLEGLISYYKKDTDVNYPTREKHIIKVIMNDMQLNEYKVYIKKFFGVPAKNNPLYVDFDEVEKRKKNYFLSATRQISNTVDGSTDSPKIRMIAKYILEGPKPSIIYSNFLENGVLPMSKILQSHGVLCGIYHGGINEEKQEDLIKKYNTGKLDVLLITTAGSESLDLKNTRQIHIMEPHFNDSKIEQLISRAIRYLSHNSLPIDKRHVIIYEWISVFPIEVKELSADEFLLKMSKKKEALFKQLDEIIKSVSV